MLPFEAGHILDLGDNLHVVPAVSPLQFRWEGLGSGTHTPQALKNSGNSSIP